MIAVLLALCLHTCHVSPVGEHLVKKYEGFFPFIYKDAAGYPTIGFGHLLKRGEMIEQPLLGEAADRLLESDLDETSRAVNGLVLVPLHQPQFDALSSFTFNVGVGRKGVKDGFGVLKNGRPSTMLVLVNAARHADVPAQFRLWASAGGKPLKGLVARRQAEAKLYSTGTQ